MLQRLLSTRWRLLLLVLPLLAVLLASGCAALDEQQRRWIFQPSKQSWGGGAAAEGMDEVWIEHTPAGARAPVRLHGLWLPQDDAAAPTLLYLHGARWDVRSSASRMRRMHALGFSVLGIDYRGFGQSTDELPSEDSAHEDALAAWQWLRARQPQVASYLYGHSLGSTIAVRLAAELPPAQAPAGLVLEGAFTSIPELVGTFKYGWLPVGPLISQRFDAGARIGQLQMPLLVVHGSEDRLVPAALGRALFERAAAPKQFVLVDGGTHHSASRTGFDAVRTAVQQLFGVPAAGAGRLLGGN